MSIRTLSFCRVFAAAVAAAAAAVLPAQVNAPGQPHRMTAGDFTGHAYPDLVYLRGDRVAFCAAPGIFQCNDSILDTVSVRDVGCLRLGQGWRDGLLLATDHGLLVWQTWPTTTLTLVDPRPWATIVTGRLFDGEQTSVAGASTDGGAVLIDDRVHGERTLPFAEGGILAIATVDWDHDGIDELAVATATRLWIGTADGVCRRENSHSIDGPAFLQRLATPNGDELAFAHRTPSGDRYLQTMSLAATHSLRINRLPLTGMSAADVDGDANDDVVVSTSDVAGPTVLYRQANGAPFVLQAGPTERIAITPALPGGVVATATAYAGDLDGDGSVDFAIPEYDGAKLAVRRSGSASEESWFETWWYEETYTEAVLTFSLTAASAPVGATHAEVLCYPVQIDGSDVLSLRPQGLARRSVELDGTSPQFEVAMPLVANSTELPRVIAIAAIIRYVVKADGRVVHAFGPQLQVCAQGANLALLESLGEIIPPPGSFSGRPSSGYVDPPVLPPKPPVPPLPPIPFDIYG